MLKTLPQRTFIPSLVQIGQVVSEKKSFEKLLTTTTTDDDGRQVMAIAHLHGLRPGELKNKVKPTTGAIKLYFIL